MKLLEVLNNCCENNNKDLLKERYVKTTNSNIIICNHASLKRIQTFLKI